MSCRPTGAADLPSDALSASAQAVSLLRGRPPTLGAGRLLCIDGPGASGKTTLARQIASDWGPGHVTTVHTDNLLEGWDGLPGLSASVEALLEPLSAGLAGTWRHWDWHTSRWAGTESVASSELLVLEGVGSWSPAIAHLVTALVWVEASSDTRRHRALARDGAEMRTHWEAWRLDEAALHARLKTRSHADLVVDTDSAAVTLRRDRDG